MTRIDSIFSEIKSETTKYSYNKKIFVASEILISDVQIFREFDSVENGLLIRFNNLDKIMLNLINGELKNNSVHTLRMNYYYGTYGYTPIFYKLGMGTEKYIEIYERGSLFTNNPILISKLKY